MDLNEKTTLIKAQYLAHYSTVCLTICLMILSMLSMRAQFQIWMKNQVQERSSSILIFTSSCPMVPNLLILIKFKGSHVVSAETLEVNQLHSVHPRPFKFLKVHSPPPSYFTPPAIPSG